MMEHKCFVFRFADVEVTEREFCLIKAGNVLPVEPKAFRVLLFLLRNPQTLITKDELLDAVWGDSAVTENSLARSIALLRRLLGDDTREPRFIATVATVGYRLVCTVEVTEEPPRKPNTSDQTNDPKALPRRSRKIAAVTGAVAAVATVLAAITVWVWQQSQAPPVVDSVVQLTDDGEPKNGRLDSDGSRVYFNEGPPGVNKVAQVSAAGGGTAPVEARLENPLIQRLVPDGSALLVSVGHLYDEEEPLWSISLPSGEQRRLGNFKVSTADVFPDGRIAFARGKELFIADNDGSSPRKVISLPGYVSNVKVSPESGRILFMEDLPGDGRGVSRLIEIAADGSDLREVSKAGENECCFEWSRDGKYLLYLSDDQGRQDIRALRLQTGLLHRKVKRTRLTIGPLSYSAALAGHDGKHIFAVAAKQRGELVRFDMKSHQFLPLLPGISAIDISFSSDGKWVAYDSYPGHTLWRSRSDGTERKQLTYPPMMAGFPVISPDGTRVAFHSFDQKLFVVNMDGGQPQEILDPGGDALWSPDGKLLLVFWPSPDGWLHVVDVLTRKITTIPSSQNLIGGWWIAQDKLVATDQTTTKFVTYDFRTPKWTNLLAGNFVNWRVSTDYKYLYYVTGGTEAEAKRLRFADHQVETITSLKNLRRAVEGGVCTDIGVAPDGSPIFTRDTGTQEIYSLVVHWP